MEDLRDKVVVVTSAARGLGAEYARAFALAGARLVLADRVPADDTLAHVETLGAQALAVHVDVRSRQDTEEMAGAAVRRWGRIDVLVNNAARYAGLYRGPLEGIPGEEWDDVMAVNVRGVWNATAAVLPAMRRQGSGAVDRKSVV